MGEREEKCDFTEKKAREIDFDVTVILNILKILLVLGKMIKIRETSKLVSES